MDIMETPSTFFGRCKCCLDYGCVKNIWMQYEVEGVAEVYAELMKETFSINWEAVENTEEFICDACITRLRDAYGFKQEVLKAEEKLYEELKDIGTSDRAEFLNENRVKIEVVEDDFQTLPRVLSNTEYCEVEYLDEIKDEIHHGEDKSQIEEEVDGEYYVVNEDENGDNVIFEVVTGGDDHETEKKLSRKRRRQEVNSESNDSSDRKYPEVLKENGMDKQRGVPTVRARRATDAETNVSATQVMNVIHSSNIKYEEAYDSNDLDSTTETGEQYVDTDRENDTADDSEGIVAKRKWPRKKRREERKRCYKNYSIDDMRSCLAAVREGTMSVSEASKCYGVPRKTIAGKLREGYMVPSDKPDEQSVKEEKNHNFVRELKQVFSLTNALPFKVKSSKFVCAYCFIAKDAFEDPDDLRIHTMTHEKEWIKHVDIMMRPHSQNETVRVDIQTLQCTACNMPLEWSELFQHLQDSHDVSVEQCTSKLIPYKLDFNNKCALCPKKFPNFLCLDSHMNSHYRNYMCSDCGDTFLAEVRLKQHSQLHNTGRYPCVECGKIFPLDKYMRKHVAIVHKKMKVFKCMHCEERFNTEFERHSHVSQEHRDKVRIIACELCGKKFDWKPYYLAHLRKVHSGVKNNKCRFCEKAFRSKYELKTHEQRHLGTGEHYCPECGKNFVSMMELRSHTRRMHNL